MFDSRPSDDPGLTAEEIVRRGEERYERDLRDRLEPLHKGEFLVLDIDSGDYEIDPDESAALQRARARRPQGLRFVKRIGYAVAHRIGGPLRAARP